MAQKTMYRAVVNSPSTTLTVAINSMDTTIPVVDTSVFATAPGIATIYDDNNTETILYTGIDTTNKTLTGCTRGFDGVARDWALGKQIARLITAYDANTFKDNIEDLNTNKAPTTHNHAGVYEPLLATENKRKISFGTATPSTLAENEIYLQHE